VSYSPMFPFKPTVLPNPAGTSVFIGARRGDPMARREQVDRLAALLNRSGPQ
jgi:predicted esterase